MQKLQKKIAKGSKTSYFDYGRQGSQTTFQLQSMLKKKHGMASKDVSKALKINDDYDYV